MRRAILATLVLATLGAAACGNDSRQRDLTRALLETNRAPAYVRRDKDGRKVWAATQTFYRNAAYAPIWLKRHRPTSKMTALVDAITHVDREGLDPALYDVTFLDDPANARKGLLDAFPPDVTGEVDVRLTYLYLQLASDLADGVSDFARADPAWHIQPETFDASAHLAKALDAGGIAESLEALKPTNPEYRALRDLLAEYRSKDAATPTGTSGAADDADRTARIQQLELNMERWRWLPRSRGSQHIVVNIPAFRLDAWEGDKVVLSMRVVVGKKDTRTPIFSDVMTHVVFSPYWNVPSTIAMNETIPSAMRDPSFLARTGMEVLDERGKIVDAASIDPERPETYRFRQKPGSKNSLGLIKFMFPNEFNVYLHDTPADSLFARATRSLSHGCVRVEDPQALAEYVLKGQPEWTRERIIAAMNAGEERTLKLRQPIPVYIGYWTVDVAPDGHVDFKPDVYGLDARQSSKLSDRRSGLGGNPRLTSAARD